MKPVFILGDGDRIRMREQITAAVKFVPKNQINSLYMGSAAKARLWWILGSEWPYTFIELALARATDLQLQDAYMYCQPYIDSVAHHKKRRWEDPIHFEQLSREAYARKYACNKEAVLAGSKDNNLYVQGYRAALMDIHNWNNE